MCFNFTEGFNLVLKALSLTPVSGYLDVKSQVCYLEQPIQLIAMEGPRLEDTKNRAVDPLGLQTVLQ